jgi:cytochrome c-type biogenesis protein CcmH/NrfF
VKEARDVSEVPSVVKAAKQVLLVGVDIALADCAICGTTIASSDATLASDLRRHIREEHGQ